MLESLITKQEWKVIGLSQTYVESGPNQRLTLGGTWNAGSF